MPVPVSVTHASGVGLGAEGAAELPTLGPFARLATNKDAAATTNSSIAANGDSAAPAIEEPTAKPASEDSRGAGAGPVLGAGAAAVETSHLRFTYPGIDGRPQPGASPVVRDMSVSLQPGTRTLLIGANGAGKTTLLKVLAGKHMVPQGSVRVLGQPPFHATALTSSGELSYIGGTWERDIAFAGYAIPLQGDISAETMIKNVTGVDPARRARLMQVLDVNPAWRMNRVSDGQRRRVQLAMGLLKPFNVLLLDEITVDLDVLGRADLLAYLRAETEERGACIVYATHIFDGLESWATHLMYLADGGLKEFGPVTQFPEIAADKLLRLVEKWLRAEQARQRQQREEDARSGKNTGRPDDIIQAEWNNGWASGRLTSSMKLSSNAVMR